MEDSIRLVYEPDNHQAAVYDRGRQIGCCSYRVQDNTWIIEHTVVDPEYGGRGIAAKLVDLVVKEAQKAGVKIIPECSYAAKWFEKHPEYGDMHA